MVFLRESPASVINRLLNNDKMKVTSMYSLLLSQAVTAVQVKIFASDVNLDMIAEIPIPMPTQMVRETEIDPADFTLYTKTFRVGQKT